MLTIFIILLLLGFLFIFISKYLEKKEENKQRLFIKESAIIIKVENDDIHTKYTVSFQKDGQNIKAETVSYYRDGKNYTKGEMVDIEYYQDKKDLKVFIIDDEMVPWYSGGPLYLFFLVIAAVLSFVGAAFIALSTFDDLTGQVPFLENLNYDILMTAIIIIFVASMILSALRLAKGLKNGKVITTKIINKEYRRETNHNDRYVTRYMFTIEDDGKKLVNSFEIDSYTDSIKKGDMVEVRIHKKHFFFEKEYQEMMKKK